MREEFFKGQYVAIMQIIEIDNMAKKLSRFSSALFLPFAVHQPLLVVPKLGLRRRWYELIHHWVFLFNGFGEAPWDIVVQIGWRYNHRVVKRMVKKLQLNMQLILDLFSI